MAAIKSLQRTTDFEVIGADMNPKAVGLYAADDAITVPPATADRWVDSISAHIGTHEIDVVVPLIDEEVAQIEELRTAAPDTAFVAPDKSFVDTCLDKYRLMTTLDETDISVPKTWTVDAAVNLNDSEYPLILKPRTDRGGRGIQVVESPDELQDALTDTTRDHEEMFVQEYLQGPEFTTSVVCTKTNSVLSVVPKEAVKKDRSTVHGVTREAPEVATSCHTIVDQFQPAGPINVQQMCDEDGVPHVIEINPRFSSSACLTVAAGVDELAILIKDSVGLPYETPASFSPDLHMLRYTDQLFVSDETLLTGGSVETDEI
jgi:carbamoyl-phosphate synthase large subunit